MLHYRKQAGRPPLHHPAGHEIGVQPFNTKLLQKTTYCRLAAPYAPGQSENFGASHVL